MAAKSRSPAGSAAAGAARAAGEGGESWLYRLEGESLGLGDGMGVIVYLLLPKLLPPSALQRMAGLLSGDARFRMLEAWAERLPFPARGHAVVDFKAGRVVAAAVPEEVRRRLEEHRSRNPTFLAASWFSLDELLRLRDLLAGYGVGFDAYTLSYANVDARGVGLKTDMGVIELRPPRPLSREERRKLLEEARRLGVSVIRLEEAEAMERAGLGALAETVPHLLWWDRLPLYGVGGFLEQRRKPYVAVEVLNIGGVWVPKPYRGLAVEGSRGWVGFEGSTLLARVGRIDGAFLQAAEEAKRAAEKFRKRCGEWEKLISALLRAEENAQRAPRGLAPLAHEGVDARVWREGDEVKVWLAPQLKRRLERELPEGVEGYLREVSQRLGRRVVLVGKKPPFRFSLGLDAAYARLVEAMERLVGAPRAVNGGTGARRAAQQTFS